MGRRQPVARRDEDAEDLLPGARLLLQPEGDGVAVDELHGDEDLVFERADVVGDHDVRVRQPRDRLRLSQRPLAPLRQRDSVAGLDPQQLDGDLAIELRIVRGVDLAHPAAPHQPENQVAADDRAASQWRGRRIDRKVRGRRARLRHLEQRPPISANPESKLRAPIRHRPTPRRPATGPTLTPRARVANYGCAMTISVSARLSTQASTRSSVSGSSAAKLSSRMRTSSRCNSARAMKSRLRSPWESCQPLSPTSCSSPEGIRARSGRGRARGKSPRLGDVLAARGPGAADQQVEEDARREDVVLVELRRGARRARATARHRARSVRRRRAAGCPSRARAARRGATPASTCRRPTAPRAARDRRAGSRTSSRRARVRRARVAKAEGTGRDERAALGGGRRRRAAGGDSRGGRRAADEARRPGRERRRPPADADVPPGDRGVASEGNDCVSLRSAPLTKRTPPRVVARAPGCSAASRESRRRQARMARAPIKKPRGTTTRQRGGRAIERAAARRVDGERAVLVAVAQLARLLRDERAVPDHALDEIVGEREPLGRPGARAPAARAPPARRARSPHTAAKREPAGRRRARARGRRARDELEEPHRRAQPAAQRERLDRLDVRDTPQELANPLRAQRLGVEAQEAMHEPLAQDGARVDGEPAGGARRRAADGGQQGDQRNPARSRRRARRCAATARAPIVAHSATSSAS